MVSVRAEGKSSGLGLEIRKRRQKRYLKDTDIEKKQQGA